MYPPVVCTCGRSLGDLFEVFKQMRADKVAEYAQKNNIVAEKIIIAADCKIEVKEILDNFKLELDCCRQVVMTWVEFNELY